MQLKTEQLDVFSNKGEQPTYTQKELKQIVTSVKGRISYLRSRLKAQGNNLSNAKVEAYNTYENIQTELKSYIALFEKTKKLNLPYIKFREIFDTEEIESFYKAIEAKTFKVTSSKMQKGITATKEEEEYSDLLSLFSQNEMI